ncbi:uncharacterized protein LOC129914700 [Episyrphus balteatus]|uniref:uncharacterized protein LOC129914700 n=1 Tax=Episyrphus balteatus TaxID=286459 RepID=UPI002485F72A|nr:uncharacterized protein LOC129914700 [Episyrphus balteatus]
MEWTRDKTLSLINEYKKRRGLWDMTHEDYRKKEMKQKLLIEVSASLGGGIPIVEIEKKFHTLRTQYHREINRMKRKEPYNSKWFGFKNLQFLSSPKAMRAGKGKLKAEITEDGVTKYIIRDASSRDSEVAGAVAAAASSITTEFLTIHRNKPATTTVTYETAAATVPAPISIGRVQKFESNRARDLEKLIEETTKDVEEPEESKPKIIKEISLPLQHHSYSSTSMTTQEESQSQHHQQHQQEHHIEEEHLSTIDIQTSVEDENIGYHHHQQHPTPARVFKIQRRDTCNEEEYYEEEQQQQQNQHQHIQSKRIYYDNGNAGNVNGNITATSPSGITMAKLQTVQSPRFRDEFATYGEYVANEMRTICNREILISLKHKINTALFEASMAELQQK